MAKKPTRQRQTLQIKVIRSVFEAVCRPLLAEEALALAKKKVPNLGVATMYRAIKNLLAEGWLRTVDLPGQSSRYERARDEHHHHFHCRRCEQVFEVESCPSAMASFSVPGFKIERHDLTFYGLCRECQG